MNKDIIQSNWSEIKAKIKPQWSKLSEEDIMQIQGSANAWIDQLQKTYGYNKQQAQKEIETFLKKHKWA